MNNSREISWVGRCDEYMSSPDCNGFRSSERGQFRSGRVSGRGDIWVGSLKMGREVESVWEAGVHIGKSERRGPGREEVSLRNNESKNQRSKWSVSPNLTVVEWEREVIKRFLLLYIFEKFHLKSFAIQLAWRMCFLLMVGGVGVGLEGRQ